MKNVYDVILNFNENPYDFYEWNENDDIIHVNKIPLLKVNKQILKEAWYQQVKFDKSLLMLIENKTEIFLKKEKIKYACLLTDEDSVFGFLFDDKGEVIKKSSLLIEELTEIIYISVPLKTLTFNYQLLNKNQLNFNTRDEIEKKEIILRYINNLNKKEEVDKLKYIYYECFDKKEESINKIINNIKKNINKKAIVEIIYNFVNIVSN